MSHALPLLEMKLMKEILYKLILKQVEQNVELQSVVSNQNKLRSKCWMEPKIEIQNKNTLFDLRN